jgi:plasmid stabilization system protein ParE
MANNIAYQTILSTRAEQEIITSWKWYEERQEKLGDRFIEEVIRQLKQIEQHPERYPVRYKSYRETIVAIFPYSIIYRINKTKKLIQVISIFHTSRNPKKKYLK